MSSAQQIILKFPHENSGVTLTSGQLRKLAEAMGGSEEKAIHIALAQLYYRLFDGSDEEVIEHAVGNNNREQYNDLLTYLEDQEIAGRNRGDE